MLRLIGTGTTDSNGVATTTYTGKGNGLIDVVAKCREVTSNEIEVIDATFIDDGTEIKNWSYKNNLEQSSDGTQCTLSQTDSSSQAVKRIDSLTPNLCFEMDIKLSSGSDFQLFTFRDGSTAKAVINSSIITDTDYHHLKMWTDSSYVYYQVDNESTSSVSLSGAYNRLYLQISGGRTVSYKNFCYYLI